MSRLRRLFVAGRITPQLLLRGIRVEAKEELKRRIELYLQEVNETPVVFRWKYKLDNLSVV